MKKCNRVHVKAILLSALAMLCMMKTLEAQYTKLIYFDSNTGAQPYSVPALSGSTLYGSIQFGGTYNKGTLFKVSTDGTDFLKIFDFDSINGSRPMASPIISGTMLYGTTIYGGAYNTGTIFKVKTDGTGFTKLIDFDSIPKGSYPIKTGLILSGNTLYGATSTGGIHDKGTIFKVSTDGGGFTKLFDFDGINDGELPINLILSENVLYGTTYSGGANNVGVIFKVDTDGNHFTKLLDLGHGTSTGDIINLIASGSILYGADAYGGGSGHGEIFKINTDGTGFTKLVDFNHVRYKGSQPYNLILSGDELYGMTEYGGAIDFEDGIAYKVKIDGSAFTKLFDFDDTNKGRNPFGSLALSDNTLYGMTPFGGAHAAGVLFKYSLLPEQFITFNAMATKVAGEADFDPGATASSHLAVTYESADTTIATIVNNKVHIIKAGSVIIYADQMGDNVSFGPAAEQMQVLTVTTSTGLKTYDAESVRIYPNPVNDLLYIKDEEATLDKLEIVNMYGQVVISAACNYPETVISTSNLYKGVYTIKLFSKTSRVFTDKLLKE